MRNSRTSITGRKIQSQIIITILMDIFQEKTMILISLNKIVG